MATPVNDGYQCGRRFFSIAQIDVIGKALLHTDCGLSFGLRVSGTPPEEVDMGELERALNQNGYFYCSDCDDWGFTEPPFCLPPFRVVCSECDKELN